MMTFYFVYPKPSTFVPDTEKCPSSWLIHLRYGTKKSLKNKEKRLDYIGRGRKMDKIAVLIPCYNEEKTIKKHSCNS